MHDTISVNDLYEVDYGDIDSILEPHQDRVQYIEELRVLLDRTDRGKYTNKTGMIIQGIDPWTPDARDRRRARPNRIYSDFLYMLYSMFAVKGVDFQRHPQKFVDFHGLCWRRTSRQELMHWNKGNRETGMFTLNQLNAVMSKMKAEGVISTDYDWTGTDHKTQLYIRLNPGRLLELFKEASERAKGERKMPPKRPKTTVRIRNKHGRFESHTPLVNQTQFLIKEKLPPPTSSVPSSSLLSPSLDKKNKTDGPAATSEYLFSLPDLRRAELDQLVSDITDFFPAVSEPTPEKQVKAIEGYFNCSDPGRKLDGYRFKLFRDYFSSTPEMQCGLDGFLAHWPMRWQQTQITDLQQQGYFDSHSTLRDFREARSDFDTGVDNRIKLQFDYGDTQIPAHIDDWGLDILILYEAYRRTNRVTELTELVAKHGEALKLRAKQWPLEALYLQELHPDFGSSVGLKVGDWNSMKQRIDATAQNALAQAMELHTFVTHGMREPLMLEILRSEERSGLKL
jgi:hypothetical protein